MTESEVLNEIFSTYKWYIGIFEDSYARVLKYRFEKGLLTYETRQMVIEKCGYTVVTIRTYSGENKNI